MHYNKSLMQYNFKYKFTYNKNCTQLSLIIKHFYNNKTFVSTV